MMIIILIFLFQYVNSFSSELVRNHCNKEMKENVMMMGQEVKSTDEYVIKVYRNDKELLINGSIVNSNERLLVTIEPLTIKQLVLEVLSETTSYFENGKCEKKNRINTNNAILILSSTNQSLSSTNIITINGVIAKSYATGVKLIKDSFILTYENSYNTNENEL